MNRWWDYSYPFRRQLKFTNADNRLDSTDVLICVLPEDMITQGKLDIEEPNFAVAFNNREIAKPVPSYIYRQDNLLLLVLQNIVDIEPLANQDSYYIYYGASPEHEGYEVEPTNDGILNVFEDPSSFSYSPIDSWVGTETGYGTTILSSKLNVIHSMSYFAITFIVTSSLTGTARIQLDDDKWEYLDLNGDTLDEDQCRVYTYQKFLVVDPTTATRTIRIENVDFDLAEENVVAMPDQVVDLSTLDESAQDFFASYQSNRGLFVSSIQVISYGSAQPGIEEVSDALSWTSKVGGTISVGE